MTVGSYDWTATKKYYSYILHATKDSAKIYFPVKAPTDDFAEWKTISAMTWASFAIVHCVRFVFVLLVDRS